MQVIQELSQILTNLIAVKSTHDNIPALEQVVGYVEQFFASESVVVKKYVKNNKPSIVISTADTRTFDVVLNGHLDVVHADSGEFIPRDQAGKIYGRGALDMKGPVSVLMLAFRDFIRTNKNVSIGLMLTTDEEVGGPDGVRYLVEDEGYRAKVVVVPDGGEIDRVVTAQKGVVRFVLTAHGSAAHASRPWMGKNAIDMISDCYAELKQMYPAPQAEDDWRPSVNLGTISGGASVNQVPDFCTAGLDFRFIETKSADKWIAEIQQICSKHEVQCTVDIVGDMCFTDPENDYIKTFIKASETVLKKAIRISGETGASDARFFSKHTIPVIISNPVGGNIHTSGEYVELASLEQYYQILMIFLKAISPVEK